MDRELDDALRSYSSQAPPAGLEERILSRARTPRRPYWLMPIAAGLFLGVLFWPTAQVEQPPAPPLAASAQPPTPAPPPPPMSRTVRRGKPRPSSFPSPVPLTREEKALVELFQHAPEIAESLNEAISPITIEELQIEPLSDNN